MFDFARISVAVPDITVGSVIKNKEDIIKKIKESAEANADFVVFPELALTGVTCQDLFFQDSLAENVNLALGEIQELSKDIKTVIILGAPLRIKGNLYSCAVIFSEGRRCGIVPKATLFAGQSRWFNTLFQPDEIMSSDIGVSPAYKIPFSEDIIFEAAEQVRFGAVLGEDARIPLSKSSQLCRMGAEIIFNLSGSFGLVCQNEKTVKALEMISENNICAYAYANASCSESTTDYIYSGKGIIAECGKILCCNEKQIDTDYVMCADVDLGKIRAVRLKNKGLFENKGEPRCVSLCSDKEAALLSDGSLYPVRRMPFVPDSEDELDKRCHDIFEMQTMALAKRMRVASKKVVIGVSGGLDSTLALLVCVEAVKKLSGKVKDVIGITLPCFGTTSRTYNNAITLMEKLGISTRNINIKNACLVHFEDIGHDEKIKDVTYENVQARERTQVLMDVANKEGAMVCGTGDLSEITLGWCTYNADHMSMYGVNAGLPKTLISHMIKSLCKKEEFACCKDTLFDIADTPISPELLPPDENGDIAQKTEEAVGPYVLHDFFMYYSLKYGFSPEKIFFLAKRAFAGEFDNEQIKKYLQVFYKRFFTQQFKRSCLPDGVKVGSVGISPRSDLMMPSDASYNDFVEKLKNL